jgi:Arc/MetJ family transcription regulator
MARLVRKNVFLDPEVLRQAQEILGVQSESEAIREALSLVAFRQEVMRGFDQVAGKAPDFRDMWEEP